MKTLARTIGLGVLFVVYMTSPANAATLEISDEAFIDVFGFVQPYMKYTFEPETDRDFGVKRARLFMAGQVNEHAGFFVGMLAGSGTDYNVKIVDAWIEARLDKRLKLNFGLVKLPFARQMQLSGAGIHTIDFHGAFLGQSARANGTGGHRDAGMVLRGILADDKVDYRLAMVHGNDQSDIPRFVGRLGYNLFDSEPSYFWKDCYFGKKKILNIGASFDIQPDGVGGEDLYYAYAADIHADIPNGKNGFIANVVYQKNGDPSGSKGLPKGHGVYGDVGYRFGEIEPLVGFDFYQPDDDVYGDSKKKIIGGLNWWIQGGKYNVKLEVSGNKWSGQEDDDWGWGMQLQTQVVFK